MKRIFIILLVLITICGCSRPDTNNKPSPGTPIVSSEQAKDVAVNVYSLSEIETINIRLLNESEMKELTEEQLQLTPKYYVIAGLVGKKKVTVYISSNEVNHHFIISDEP